MEKTNELERLESVISSLYRLSLFKDKESNLTLIVVARFLLKELNSIAKDEEQKVVKEMIGYLNKNGIMITLEQVNDENWEQRTLCNE